MLKRTTTAGPIHPYRLVCLRTDVPIRLVVSNYPEAEHASGTDIAEWGDFAPPPTRPIRLRPSAHVEVPP